MRTTELGMQLSIHVALHKVAMGWNSVHKRLTFSNTRAPFLPPPLPQVMEGQMPAILKLNKLTEQWLVAQQHNQKSSCWDDDQSSASWFLWREWHKVELATTEGNPDVCQQECNVGLSRHRQVSSSDHVHPPWRHRWDGRVALQHRSRGDGAWGEFLGVGGGRWKREWQSKNSRLTGKMTMRARWIPSWKFPRHVSQMRAVSPSLGAVNRNVATKWYHHFPFQHER